LEAEGKKIASTPSGALKLQAYKLKYMLSKNDFALGFQLLALKVGV
jgi:hypothetical protein